MHSIPIQILIEAANAMKAAKDSSATTPMPLNTWSQLLYAHGKLQYHLDQILKDQKIPVTQD